MVSQVWRGSYFVPYFLGFSSIRSFSIDTVSSVGTSSCCTFSCHTFSFCTFSCCTFSFCIFSCRTFSFCIFYCCQTFAPSKSITSTLSTTFSTSSTYSPSSTSPTSSTSSTYEILGLVRWLHLIPSLCLQFDSLCCCSNCRFCVSGLTLWLAQGL